MDIREQIVTTARSHLGAKWEHQARRADAMDCAGLIVLVGLECGLIEDGFVDFTNYRRSPDGDKFKNMFDTYAEPTVWRKAKSGDIAIFGWGRYGFHCGILVFKDNQPWLIHSFADVGKVIEQPLTDSLLKLLKHVYTYKGIN